MDIQLWRTVRVIGLLQHGRASRAAWLFQCPAYMLVPLQLPFPILGPYSLLKSLQTELRLPRSKSNPETWRLSLNISSQWTVTLVQKRGNEGEQASLPCLCLHTLRPQR